MVLSGDRDEEGPPMKDWLNQVDDRIVKDIKIPDGPNIVVNTLITECNGVYETWVRAGELNFKTAEGSLDAMKAKSLRVRGLLQDRRLWGMLRSFDDIAQMALRI